MKKLTLLLLLAATASWAQTLTSTQTLQANIISAAHSGTLYITPVGNVSNATETNVSQLAGIVGTLNNLYVNATAPGGSDTIIVTIDKNTTGQTLTCTITGAAAACNDTTHSFAVVATDLLSIKAVYSTSVTGAVSFTMSLTNATGTGVTVNNHTLFAGSAPTLSACGTSPTNTSATDNAGTVVLGTGNVQKCTMTFATAFTVAPACYIQTNAGGSAGYVQAVSTTAVTFRVLATGPSKFYYGCF